jgi:[protein-PII] uridylyltransferase
MRANRHSAPEPSSALARLQAETEDLRRHFLKHGRGEDVLQRRTVLVDGAVFDAFDQFLAPSFSRGLALLAVGGYGRGELFPHSDIDLLILIDGAPPAGAAKEALARFLQVLWDEGLRISHSVHTVRECCELHEGNIELTVSLLDQRFLIGDRAPYLDLSNRSPKFLQAQRNNLSRHLCRMTHQRHAKFQSTLYHLEPNVKEAPGGLRDVHLSHWLGKLWERPSTEGNDLTFLYAVRCWLHYQSQRDNNLLTFDFQEQCAEFKPLGVSGPEHLMHAYFRDARAIQRSALRAMESFEEKSSSLLAGFRDWRSRLSTSEFTVSRDKVLFRAHEQLHSDPSLVIRAFQFVGRHNIPLHADSERRLRENLPAFRSWLATAPTLWPGLREILASSHASRALRAMHDAGVLGTLFPEWAGIECHVVRDFNHRYTVDEHTLIALESLEELRDAKEPERQRYSRLLQEVDTIAILRLALLFHDTGKGEENDSHAAESAGLAEQVAERLAVPAGERQMLRALIEQHLVLSSAMNSRDLSDPETARWLADRIGTIEILKALTLLTYADISAVHPGALSPWRMEQLWRVYLTVHRELTRDLDEDRITATGASDPEQQEFLKGFPTRYLRVHTRDEIHRHVELERQRKVSNVVIDIDKQGGAYQLTVLAKDRHFLFASLAGALASFGLNIVKAEAFANQQGTILDTFSFVDPQRNLELNPSELDRLRQVLERVTLGKIDVRTLLKSRPRPPAPSKGSQVQASIAFDSEASATATLVEVVAQDRPGLLYDLASSLSGAGCNIEVVLIDTEAHRAIDVFYVTAHGGKIEPALQEQVRLRLLQVC